MTFRRKALLTGIVACAAASALGDTFTVLNTGDAGADTFRDAVTQANTNAGMDNIEFDLNVALPMEIILESNIIVTDPVIIDGSTQSNYTTGPIVTLAVDASFPDNGMLKLNAGSDNSIVKSLAFKCSSLDYVRHVYVTDSNYIAIEDCRFEATADGNINTGIDLEKSIGSIVYHCEFFNMNWGVNLVISRGTLVGDCSFGRTFSGEVIGSIDIGIFLNGSPGSPNTEIGPIFGNDENVIINCKDGIVLSSSSDSTHIYSNRIFDCDDDAIDSNVASVVSDLAARRINGNIEISGSLTTATLNQFYKVQFFADETSDVLEAIQAQWYLGETLVQHESTSGTDFLVTLPDNLPLGKPLSISATSTQLPGGTTSELSASAEIELITVASQPSPGANPDWIPSGIDSGPEYTLDPTTPDDVDVLRSSDALYVIVRPSVGRYRIAGWQNPALVSMDDVGPTNLIRGKFFVYTTNPRTAPLNTVPNFRIRLSNEAAVLATVNYEYARTGTGGLAREPFYDLANSPDAELHAGTSLRPSASSAKPSLYRVDFYPTNVPSDAGSNIGASFESYSTQNTADGTLALAGVSLAVYPIDTLVDNSPEILYTYQTYDNWPIIVPANESWAVMQPGQFNAENDFQPGRLQTLDLPGEVPPASLAQVFETTTDGGFIDTSGIPADKFGVGLMTFTSTDNTETPRLQSGKMYFASFVVTSDMQTSSSDPNAVVQGGMNFQIQTAMGCMTSRLELPGPVNAATVNTTSGKILAESLPGLGCQVSAPISILAGVQIDPSAFFPAGENGSVYTVLLSSPEPSDLFPDTTATPALDALFTEPARGDAADSALDINIGITAIQSPTTLRLTPGLVVPWSQPNHTNIHILGAVLGSVDQIDDGGYTY